MNVTVDELFMKIGVLTVERDALAAENARLKAEISAIQSDRTDRAEVKESRD